MIRLLFVSTFFYVTLISCFGSYRVDCAAIGGPMHLNIHLDQQLEQNQTEAKPDLPHQQADSKKPLPAKVNSSHTSTTLDHGFSAINMIKENFGRQDVGQEVGDRVGTILSGVLGGGLGNVFQGSSSFIGNVNAQEEVDFVLNNVAPPFETILNYGFEGLKKYFGIGQTTVRTVVVTHPAEEHLYLQPVVYENGTVQYIPIYHTVTKPPTILTVTSPPVEDNELGDIDTSIIEQEKEESLLAAYPLVNSRVDRLH